MTDNMSKKAEYKLTLQEKCFDGFLILALILLLAVLAFVIFSMLSGEDFVGMALQAMYYS